MPPKPVSLAYAGRKLTGPPEGYGKKKELQVKHWISGLPRPDETELAEVASVATLTEIDGSKEDLYRSLRDSTDGYGPWTAAVRPGANGTPPFPEPPRATVPGARPGTAGAGKGPGIPPRAPDAAGLRASGQSAGPSPRPGQTPAGAGGPTRPGTGTPGGPGTTPTAGFTPKPDAGGPGVAGFPAGPGVGPGRPGTPPGPAKGGPGRGGPAVPSGPPTSAAGAGGAGTSGSAAPLELVATGGSAGMDGDMAVAAGLLVARAEATQPEGLPPEEKYKRALLLALEEQKRFQDEVAVRRAEAAEAELGRARAEALSHKQEAQRLKLDAEERRDESGEALARMQAELEAAAAQLREQTARATKAMEASAADAAAARAAAASAQRELAILKRHFEVDRARMDAMVASMQSDLQTERAAAASAKAERDRVATALQMEAAARKAAEDSERKALAAAAKQAETQDAIQTASAAAAAARQRVAAAEQRAAAVRAADPSAAVLDGSAAAAAAGPRAGGSARHSGATTPRGAAAGPPLSPRGAGTPGAAKAGSPGGPSPNGSPSQHPADAAAAAAAARADGHRALGQGLAADRRQLGELMQMQKRAAAAAELADAKAVQAALAAAPEPLRALGLAFRAYLCVGEGGAPQDSPAAALAARLSGAGYRVYLDPVAAQANPDPLYEVPSAPLVGVSAAVVVLCSPGLLMRPLPRGELCAASLHGCPLVLVCPPGLTMEALSQGPEQPLLLPSHADAAGAHLDLALDALREAWPSRLELALDSPAAAAPAAAAIAPRLGLPDAALALLPPEALKPLAVNRGRCIPDLAFLNAPSALTLLGPAAGPNGGAGAMSMHGAPRNGGVAVGAGVNVAALQHLKLVFQGAGGGGNGGGGSGGGGSGAGSGAGAGAPTGPLVEMLCAVLRGNHTLTALTLRGCPASAARTITEAVLASPVCRVATITVSSRVPVAALAGRAAGPGAGPGPAPSIVLLGGGREGEGGAGSRPSVAEPPFTDEDAEVVAAALRSRAAALASASSSSAAAAPNGGGAGDQADEDDAEDEAGAGVRDGADRGQQPGASGSGSGPPPLEALSFPASCNGRLGRAAVGALVGALAALVPLGLQAVNGVDLRDAAAAAGPPGAGGGRRGGGTGMLDLGGSRCGPVVLSLVLQQMQAALPSLTAINLTACEVGAIGAAALAAAAGGGGLPALKTACLADNLLGPEGVESVLAAVLGSGGAGGGACSVLDLSLNSLGDAGCKALAKALPPLGGSLAVLALSHNGIGTEGTRALAGALPACAGLQELLLAGNQLGDTAARELAAALQRLPKLQVLHLQDNHRLAADGVAGLAGALPGLPALRELDLARCHAGNEGARHIAKALASHPSLTRLSLEGCKLRADGAAHLAAALASSPSTPPSPGGAGPSSSNPSSASSSAPTGCRLASLELARNQLGDRGAAFLAEGLGRNTSLTALDLRSNAIGLIGCRALGAALRERNAGVRALAVGGNEADDEVLQALEDLAASTRHVVLRAPPPAPEPRPTPAQRAAADAARGGPSQPPRRSAAATAVVGPQRTLSARGAPPGADAATPPLPRRASIGSRAAAAAAAPPPTGAAAASPGPSASTPGGPASAAARAAALLADPSRRMSDGSPPLGPAAAAGLKMVMDYRRGAMDLDLELASHLGPEVSLSGLTLGAAMGLTPVKGEGGGGGPDARSSGAGFGVVEIDGERDEELEELLRRYRTKPGEGGDGSPESGVPFRDLGYTG
ncbi:hypothetical protein HYH03_017832 [Edaphochlamys debaryana]|uniref:Uncharacterized protein n=1 Tax=Edaphochlamys debaryana TaxID=47281 RepID=A0A835XH72_9CHLO|nr:hypothetical protein HYH03_017832 [Edaphochlamys debaryana]|eukprot:KAG2483285.1 hypothetical protein HYH03_017832 [Edaphochlamys debaryana]